jgi:REP element-mobilizing transposase RayT
MPAYSRRQIVVEGQIGVYHCIARCVRRAFLCGVDPLTGKDHEHRKYWVRDRMRKLASIFAIDVCGYAVMSNHMHVVLRIRPDLADTWTDEEIAVRWMRLHPPRDPVTGRAAEPAECDLNAIIANPERVALLRKQLASLSLFMGRLSEPIARRANREDGCTGRFWEGRFKSQALLDEAAILSCSVYVDLNPVRAGIAELPEQSEFTSAFDRIRSLLTKKQPLAAVAHSSDGNSDKSGSNEPPPASDQRRPDEWLCELTLEEGPKAELAVNAPTHLMGSVVIECSKATAKTPPSSSRGGDVARASNQGYLPITVEKYLSLVDWTGRQLRATAGALIPAELAPILERLGIESDRWLDTVRHFGRRFKRAAGRHDSMAALASRSGRSWLQGQRAAAIAFGP